MNLANWSRPSCLDGMDLGDSIERDQGISKSGSSIVRTTIVELAWLWLLDHGLGAMPAKLASWRRYVEAERNAIIKEAVPQHPNIGADDPTLLAQFDCNQDADNGIITCSRRGGQTDFHRYLLWAGGWFAHRMVHRAGPGICPRLHSIFLGRPTVMTASSIRRHLTQSGPPVG
jgi:hypothetical protein